MTALFSRINTFSPVVSYVFFNLQRKMKGGYLCIHVTVHPHDHSCAHIAKVDILERLACCRCWCKVVYFVPVSIVDWQTTLPSSTDKPFIDAFTFFRQSNVWLCCPRSERKIQSPKSAHSDTHYLCPTELFGSSRPYSTCLWKFGIEQNMYRCT